MAAAANFSLDLSGHAELISAGVVLLAVLAIYQVFFTIRYPSNLPLAGEPSGRRWFTPKTRLRYLTDCAALHRETYETFTKAGKTVLMPGFGVRNEIILPPSAMQWVTSQRHSLSKLHAFMEFEQAKYTLGDDMYSFDAWHIHLIRTESNAVLEKIYASIGDELGCAFDKYFGIDEENWKEIDLFKVLRIVVAQATSRFNVGLPLCRNEQYLTDLLKVIDNLVLIRGTLGICPRILKPIVGRLVSFRMPGYLENVKKHLEPIYRERVAALEGGRDNQGCEPQDYLEIMMRYAQRERPKELTLDIINKRLCVHNFGSMHQTTILATNMFLNIMGSDDEFNTISTLRDEISRVHGIYGGEWTKLKVAHMYRADSVARETMRLNPIGNRALGRKVVADGVVTEDGIKLPKGASTSFFGYPVHMDKENYEDPMKYDPFRFSRAREAVADADGKVGLSELSFVSTSPLYLPFGHGKDACPGRFLADFELKMIIEYVFTNYDIEFPAEYGGIRPPNVWIAEANLPPPGARIRVRRRKIEPK